METVTYNGIQWKLESIDFVDVGGRRIWPWSDQASASNARSSTALTPPVMDGVERFPVTNTVETEPSPPFDIQRAREDMEAYEAAWRDAERKQALFASLFTVYFAPEKPPYLAGVCEIELAAAVDAAIERFPDQFAAAGHDEAALAILVADVMRQMRGLANPRTVQRTIAERAVRGNEAA